MTASAPDQGAAALDAAPGAGPSVDMSNTAAEIRAYAEGLGVTVPAKASKARMLELIEGASS